MYKRRHVLIIILCAIFSTLIAMYAVPLPARLNYNHARLLRAANHEPLYVFLSEDDKWRIKRPLEEIDHNYIKNLLQFEDRRFYYHLGVDPFALLRALAQNIIKHHIVSGGSTITMQLVRVLEPRPRTWSSKLIEIFRATQLELRLSKRAILEAYVTFIPFGKNIEGIEAAAYRYFGHSSQALSQDEITLLLAVPQDPESRYPDERHAIALSAALHKVHRRLDFQGPPANALTSLKPFVRNLPHVAHWLREKFPQNSIYDSTLNKNIQLMAEHVLMRHQPMLRSFDIHNGSVVVVEQKTSAIRALIGNFDFNDTEHAGQIAGFKQMRSPGSTLKPLLYALSLERGLILPEHRVLDVPGQFSGYTPRNFSGTYQGLVRMEDALVQSLNIPFVNLLKQYGVSSFVSALCRMGVQAACSQQNSYGLSVIIGGLAVSPLELATLYNTLAKGGLYEPVHILKEEITTAKKPEKLEFLSPAAVTLTERALQRKDRPDFPDRARFNNQNHHIYWKTGTSYGRHDAWAAGYDDQFTVIVWLGNFNNQSSHELVGAEVAGPILFDLLEGLQLSHADSTEFNQSPRGRQNSDLIKVEVCAYSGYLPSKACPEKIEVQGLKHHVPTSTCPYHVQLDIDNKTGRAYTTTCAKQGPFHQGRFIRLPTSLMRLFNQKLIADSFLADQHLAPAWLPQCQNAEQDERLTIVHPVLGQTLILIDRVPIQQQMVPFEAETAQPKQTLTWFVDGVMLGQEKADKPLFWTPVIGTHTITVVDDTGHSATRIFKVSH